MCGLAGWINSCNSYKYNINDSKKYIGARGPDEIKEFLSESGRIKLHHSRLSINGLVKRAHSHWKAQMAKE